MSGQPGRRQAFLSPLFTWRSAIAESELPPRARLVAMILSLHMNERGDSCMPSIVQLRAETRMGPNSVLDGISILEKEGFLSVDRGSQGRGRKNRYTAVVTDEMVLAFLDARPRLKEKILRENLSLEQKDTGGDLLGGIKDTETGHKDVETKDVGEFANAHSPGTALARRTTDEDPRIPKKVDRTPVKDDEGKLAIAVLDEWNRQTGQRLGSSDWVKKIVMRIREHPELGFAEHAHIITSSLAAPWWRGPASPSVVYGSGAQFERSITAITAPGPQRDTNRAGDRAMRLARELAQGGKEGE